MKNLCVVFFHSACTSASTVCVHSECSQKLMIWKHDETKRKKRDKRKSAKLIAIPKLIVTTEKQSIVEIPKKTRKKK